MLVKRIKPSRLLPKPYLLAMTGVFHDNNMHIYITNQPRLWSIENNLFPVNVLWFYCCKVLYTVPFVWDYNQASSWLALSAVFRDTTKYLFPASHCNLLLWFYCLQWFYWFYCCLRKAKSLQLPPIIPDSNQLITPVRYDLI